MKKRPHLIKAYVMKDSTDIFCSECLSMIYGYDETPCPVCGAKIDVNIIKEISYSDFKERYRNLRYAEIAGSH